MTFLIELLAVSVVVVLVGFGVHLVDVVRDGGPSSHVSLSRRLSHRVSRRVAAVRRARRNRPPAWDRPSRLA
jgi:hypothetical protein